MTLSAIKMNLSAIIVGILVALLAPLLVGVVTAAGALLSLIRGVATTTTRTASKPTNSTAARSGKDAEVVVKMPEGRRRVKELRSAA